MRTDIKKKEGNGYAPDWTAELYEFRIRHDEREILSAYAEAGTPLPLAKPGKILLRVFVTFHGDKVILLFSGYDKGKDPSKKRQQKEIERARKLLRAWQVEQAAAKRKRRPGRASPRITP